MKELKNKEVIIGLIVLIILLAMALVLIVRRESRQMDGDRMPDKYVTEEKKEAGQEQPQAEKKDAVSLDDEMKELQLAEPAEAEVSLGKESVKEESATLDSLALSSNQNESGEYFMEPVLSDRVFDEKEISQLDELYYYWDAYKLEAVADLIRLPRVRTTFTNELKDTNQFYYYGSVNSDGEPDGSGLAVYEDNAYYCGEWKDGKRHGKGMWLQIFPDKPATINGIPGVTEHSYNGEWKNNYPNGSGQEHYEYDEEEMCDKEIITNVIGSFKDGYYDGELYIITFQKPDTQIDWEANASKGVFEYRHDRYNTIGRRAVWEMMKKENAVDEFFWIEEVENENWGIFGLKKMN